MALVYIKLLKWLWSRGDRGSNRNRHCTNQTETGSYGSDLCYKEEKTKKNKKLLWVGFISFSLVIFNISELKNFWAIELL
ncbi:hypothetical protein LWI28_010556 [Acer negundo]|uniref:Uncharacterized protein n=1 Tax=Acer negundo TaxID=4023 RepID=A0AAD5NWZ1_ACENE|nr:hypothetical protein LWI28_010556 [Acer negundo]